MNSCSLLQVVTKRLYHNPLHPIIPLKNNQTSHLGNGYFPSLRVCGESPADAPREPYGRRRRSAGTKKSKYAFSAISGASRPSYTNAVRTERERGRARRRTFSRTSFSTDAGIRVCRLISTTQTELFVWTRRSIFSMSFQCALYHKGGELSNKNRAAILIFPDSRPLA